MTLGDMEVPLENIDGMWESVDVTNDAWGYAWYDQNWKSPKQNPEESDINRGERRYLYVECGAGWYGKYSGDGIRNLAVLQENGLPGILRSFMERAHLRGSMRCRGGMLCIARVNFISVCMNGRDPENFTCPDLRMR